ncbi:hypothetical protein GBF35_04895 [Nonomuraea phyllanthi]|uniref:hypothetical protein n=1 Tax=Nonomuraea phyllanthi TaxID=2219224 RepID=UPI0012932004|nr:hypothetical protein [Nonomuraea phyllanthi]QFY06101.1 hypothetical protein GBF35_04895 [Nonomuraea phyllanthi]
MRGQEPGSEHDRREADSSAAPATPPPSFGQTSGRDGPSASAPADGTSAASPHADDAARGTTRAPYAEPPHGPADDAASDPFDAAPPAPAGGAASDPYDATPYGPARGHLDTAAGSAEHDARDRLDGAPHGPADEPAHGPFGNAPHGPAERDARSPFDATIASAAETRSTPPAQPTSAPSFPAPSFPAPSFPAPSADSPSVPSPAAPSPFGTPPPGPSVSDSAPAGLSSPATTPSSPSAPGSAPSSPSAHGSAPSSPPAHGSGASAPGSAPFGTSVSGSAHSGLSTPGTVPSSLSTPGTAPSGPSAPGSASFGASGSGFPASRPSAAPPSGKVADSGGRPVGPVFHGPPPNLPAPDETPGAQPWEVTGDDAAPYDWYADDTDPTYPGGYTSPATLSDQPGNERARTSRTRAIPPWDEVEAESITRSTDQPVPPVLGASDVPTEAATPGEPMAPDGPHVPGASPTSDGLYVPGAPAWEPPPAFTAAAAGMPVWPAPVSDPHAMPPWPAATGELVAEPDSDEPAFDATATNPEGFTRPAHYFHPGTARRETSEQASPQHPEAQRPEAQQAGAEHPEAQHPSTQRPDTQHPRAQHEESQHSEVQPPSARGPEAHHPGAQPSNAQQPQAQHPEGQHQGAGQPEGRQLETGHQEGHQAEGRRPGTQQPEGGRPGAQRPSAPAVGNSGTAAGKPTAAAEGKPDAAAPDKSEAPEAPVTSASEAPAPTPKQPTVPLSASIAPPRDEAQDATTRPPAKLPQNTRRPAHYFDPKAAKRDPQPLSLSDPATPPAHPPAPGDVPVWPPTQAEGKLPDLPFSKDTWGQKSPGGGAPAFPSGAFKQPPFQTPPPPPAPPARSKRALLVTLGALALAGVATGGFFAWQAVSNPAPTTAAAARPTASAQASTEVPAAEPTDAPEGTSILNSDQTDPRKWSLSEAFPKRKVSAAGATFTRVKAGMESSCDKAATGAFADALQEQKCTRVLRATYVDKKHRYAVTTGIAVLPDKDAAAAADQAKDLSRNVWFRPLPGKDGSGGERVDIAGGYAAGMVWGRYIVFSYATYADGHTPDAKDKALPKVSGAFRDETSLVLEHRLTKD